MASKLVRERLLCTTPLASVLAYVGLYAAAAWRFPGGPRREPERLRFSVAENYWCDLVEPVTHGGRRNPARPYAIAAMLQLALGHVLLWRRAARLFRHAPKRAALARGTAVAASAIVPLVATRHHGIAINASAALGLTPLALVLSATTDRALRVASTSALGLVLTTYLLWSGQVGKRAIPIVQKLATAAWLAWMAVLAARVATSGAAEPRSRLLTSRPLSKRPFSAGRAGKELFPSGRPG